MADCTDDRHTCIALALAFFAEMAAVEQTDGLTAAAVERCNRGRNMAVVRNDLDAWSHIECDTCRTPAPPAAEILKAHGLIRLGWHCTGGKHICPGCPHPADERVGGQRDTRAMP